ncbi:MAG: FtsX-like permease family protein, partial [Planctomycetes bacterium]|nr:FtsX-like permease family protein [Planctomycetota bacterium]
QFVDDTKPMAVTALDRVRSVNGVEWASPLFKSILVAKLPNGGRQLCDVVGVDDATLIGAPAVVVEGKVEDLRKPDAIFVETRGARKQLMQPATDDPNGPKRPMEVGDVLELNERRAVVVGIAETRPSFQNVPTIYTTYFRAIGFAPANRRTLSMVLVKAAPEQDVLQLKQRIETETGLSAYTPEEFSWKTLNYWMNQTGIPINFGIAILLGFLVGVAIAGQMFYNFTLDNLKYFGAMKAMGCTSVQLLVMVALQGLAAGVLGLGLGLGLTAAFGLSVPPDKLAFKLTWHLPLLSAGAVTIIVVGASLLSMLKVIRLDPKEVFSG